MYYPNSIEENCFDQPHIDQVFSVIKKNIPVYFQKYIDSEGSNYISADSIQKLADKFGATAKPSHKTKNVKQILERTVAEAILDFESDRHSYLEILDQEALSEYKLDVPSFKNKVLRDQIPVIRRTLQNKAAKELDKYRIAFKDAQPGDLFKVTQNIIILANQIKNDWYKPENLEDICTLKELVYDQFDQDDFSAWGVIGGGIKSHFIYKLHPNIFPNRSREAIWAFWYLSERKSFGCKEDSEFLMIKRDVGSTQQNFFYPYGLFALYAIRTYKELKSLYFKNGIQIDSGYRFVIVDSYLSFVARQHQREIDDLKKQSEGYQYEY